jgi:hypothetical protein
MFYLSSPQKKIKVRMFSGAENLMNVISDDGRL